MKRIKDVKKFTTEIQKAIDSGEINSENVWRYIADNTNIVEQAANKNAKGIKLSIFFAGIKWALECIRVEDEDLVLADDDDDDE